MKRSVILGAGVMGTAFATPLSDNGFAVDLVGTPLDSTAIKAMQKTRIHPRLKAPIGESVTAHDTNALGSVLQEAPDLLVIGVSTPGIEWAIEALLKTLQGTPPVVLLTKGIAPVPDRIATLPELVRQRFAAEGKTLGPVGAVGGPCIAGELVVRRPTSAIIGFEEDALAAQWAKRLSTPTYQLSHTRDLMGLEICAALKNFFAIGVCVPAGELPQNPAPNEAGLFNAAASLFHQAVAELALITVASGGAAQTAYGLAGLGDLHVTTQAGRNSRLGKLIGQGMGYKAAMRGPLQGETVEGALVAQTLAAPLAILDQQGRLTRSQIPLAHAIVDCIFQGREMKKYLIASRH